jgi:hypothetical protein
MLSNMPKSVFNGLAALTLAIPVVAWSTLPRVHNVQTQLFHHFYERTPATPGTSHVIGSSNATFSWQEGTLHGFGNIQVKTKADTFELKLVRISSATADEVSGEWDVSKNGSPTCAGCKGYLYVSAPDVGYDYLKGYINNTDGSVNYSFGADFKSRYEY